MANITRRSKKNPWRNTREDYKIPWDNIKAMLLVFLLPLVIYTMAINIVYRVPQFYSFYFTRTDIASEIPYEIKGEDLTRTFARYMEHRSQEFGLVENSEYKPQNVFNKKDAEVMRILREYLDQLAIIGIILTIFTTVVIIKLYKKGHKGLLYKRFLNSNMVFTIILLGNFLLFVIDPVRESVFQKKFGAGFEPGDVLMVLMRGGLPVYGGIATIIIGIIIFGLLWYLANIFITRRKMFINKN